MLIPTFADTGLEGAFHNLGLELSFSKLISRKTLQS